MEVYVVVRCTDVGSIAGVFSTQEKAAEYVSKHAYTAFIITKHTIDSEV